eukprot:gene2533-biopygen3559
MSGKMRIPSLNSSLYFQGILDNYSKYSIVTFHKTKDTVPKDTIIELERYEVLTENKIGKILCDNATEYTCSEFTNWCKSKGITQQFTVPGNPSTNGAPEHLNRTLHDRSTALLLSSKFPKRLIGYSDKRKAYKVVDTNNKIIDARDITFNESEKLAGLKDFPGPDTEILGDYQDDIPHKPEPHEPSKPFRQYPNRRSALNARKINPHTDHEGDTNSEHSHEHNPASTPEIVADVNQTNDSPAHGHATDPLASISAHDIGPPDPFIRTSAKATRSPDFFTNLAAEEVPIPKNETEALSIEYSAEWIDAMTSEVASLSDMKTWTLSELPHGSKSIGTQWVFDLIRLEPGIRESLLLDVSTSFLNGGVEEEIYCSQPPASRKTTESVACGNVSMASSKHLPSGTSESRKT